MRVFVDTNVWYPIRTADLILCAVEYNLIDLAWSDESLAELTRVLIHVKGLKPESVENFVEAIRSTAPSGRIIPRSYRHLIERMQGPDVDDHIFSAAVRGGSVDVLLTENVIDLPQEDVGPRCRVLRPDELFSELVVTYPIEFARLVVEMSANLRNPPKTARMVLSQLRKSGLTRFADAVEILID